jgi:hypothetical protein
VASPVSVPLHSVGWLRALGMDVHLYSLELVAARCDAPTLEQRGHPLELMEATKVKRCTKGPHAA